MNSFILLIFIKHREFRYESNAASFHIELIVMLREIYLLVSEIAYNKDGGGK